MITIYRACSKKSVGPPPIYKDEPSKTKLLKLCLESFLRTGPDEIIFLLDRVEDTSIFEKYGKVIDCGGFGNVGTFHKQIELGKEMDKVFFCEDDYYWRPNTFKLLEKAVDYFDFISPYDHPSHYEPQFGNHFETKMIDGIVYRDSPSNTLTFATSKRVLQDNWIKMMTFGMWDHPMFTSLKEDGFRIWCPTYSFATHMVDGLMAPNVDWPFLKTLT